MLFMHAWTSDEHNCHLVRTVVAFKGCVELKL